MLGVNVPLVPFQHQFLVTDVIKGLPQQLPTIRDKDSLIYYKKEVDGLIMGGYERNGIPWAIDGVPNDFTSQLLDPDFDHFQSLTGPAMKRTPCLESTRISNCLTVRKRSRLMATLLWDRLRSWTIVLLLQALMPSALLPGAAPGV